MQSVIQRYIQQGALETVLGIGHFLRVVVDRDVRGQKSNFGHCTLRVANGLAGCTKGSVDLFDRV